MKKKLFFTFASVLMLLSGFVSCSNEYFENDFVQDMPQKTRVAKTMTKEDVQARLAELNEKYNCNFLIDSNIASEEFNDLFFTTLENVMKKRTRIDAKNEKMEDWLIDQISVASTSQTLDSEVVVDHNKVYTGSYTCYDSFNSHQFTEFNSRFNIYLYSISYHYEYGRNSRLYFESFNNQTVYSKSNMPKTEENEALSAQAIIELGKIFDVKYVDKSLMLESNISYNSDRPTDLSNVDFGYSYMFTINEEYFEAVSTNNHRAFAIQHVKNLL